VTEAHETQREYLLLSVFVVIWGGNFVLAEIGLRELAPVAFSAARYLIGAVAVTALLWTTRGTSGDHRSMTPSDLGLLLAAAVIGGVAAPWAGIEGLARTHAGRAALWVAAGPVVSVLAGRVLRTERLGRRTLWAVALTVSGAILLGLDGIQSGSSSGDLLLVSGVTLAAVDLHLLRKLLHRHSPMRVAAMRTMAGAALYAMVAIPWLAEVRWGDLASETWVALLVGGILAIAFGQWVQARAIRHLGPTRVSSFYLAVPVVTAALGWAILSNQPTGSELLAGLVILAGVTVLVRPATKRERNSISMDAEAKDLSKDAPRRPPLDPEPVYHSYRSDSTGSRSAARVD
jgi:drug/metabolite transporter (DMT)-like permease